MYIYIFFKWFIFQKILMSKQVFNQSLNSNDKGNSERLNQEKPVHWINSFANTFNAAIVLYKYKKKKKKKEKKSKDSCLCGVHLHVFSWCGGVKQRSPRISLLDLSILLIRKFFVWILTFYVIKYLHTNC